MLKNILKPILLIAFLIIALPSFSQFLKRSGQKITDESGNEFILRGMGLGGWMLQEPYMMEMSDFASAQWQIREKIQALIGAANTDAFYDAWHANHCTKRDIDSLAAWGFNSVRLPMHYNLYTLPIEQEPVPGSQTWLDKGFALTDSLIKWCSARHMYVILDLHAAPGGQGKDYAICDGNPAKSSLWESDANKQKTIALWRKLAERYANEPWVGGYDILNEPNWAFTAGGNQNGCSENTNAPLRQLMISITNAIRQVDTKHLIIIEGNCWGNNYNGIFPVWDVNMAVSFHKYWSYNDLNSIQGMLNIRSQNNIPLWMGESGENSNAWFTDAIKLAESNRIGWAWWPLKKINSIVGPMTITKTPEYQTLLDYWKNGGTTPSSTFAYYTLMQMASNAKPEYCTYHKDVIDAMFRQVYDSSTIPFAHHVIPGNIHCTDYDLGRFNKAYFDTDIATYQVSSGTYTNWNAGNSYRNDGVDIQPSTDQNAGSNGYDVGWTQDGEWMKYTVRVDSTAAYNLQLRYAGPAGSKVMVTSDEADISGITTVPSSGGYTTWSTLVMNDVVLYKGTRNLKLKFVKSGINTEFMNFTVSKKITDVPMHVVSAGTGQTDELITLSLNKMTVPSTISDSGLVCTVNHNPVAVKSLVVSSENAAQLILAVDRQLFSTDTILLSYSGGRIKATDGTALQNFTDLRVQNNLPAYFPIPGKIEAEAFSLNVGMQLETTTDTGGGQDVGYTDAGDYLDYRISVKKSGTYNIEVRSSCYNSAGTLQVLQMNNNDEILNSCTISIPVTGGWQTWKSVNADISLIQGAGKLRIKIIQSGFNLNWYKFTDKSQGILDPSLQHIRIFPNPAQNELTLETDQPKGLPKTLRLRSFSGMAVKEVRLPVLSSTCRVFVGDLPKGLYLLEFDEDGTVFRTKLILE